jgi:hypothetical protein
LAIVDVIPGFTYGTIESFVRRNLYPTIDFESTSIIDVDEPMVAHAG